MTAITSSVRLVTSPSRPSTRILVRHDAKRHLPYLIGVIAAVIGGGAYLWFEILEPRLIPRNWGTVTDGLVYRSGQLSKWVVKRTLQQHSIGLIIQMSADREGKEHQDAERLTAAELGIRRLLFPLRGDGTGDIDSYIHAVQALVEARDAAVPCVVHCGAGTYRTGGVIALYRTLVEGRTADEAMREMKDYGLRRENKGEPNLIAFLNLNICRIAQALIAEGVISDLPPSGLPRFSLDESESGEQ